MHHNGYIILNSSLISSEELFLLCHYLQKVKLYDDYILEIIFRGHYDAIEELMKFMFSTTKGDNYFVQHGTILVFYDYYSYEYARENRVDIHLPSDLSVLEQHQLLFLGKLIKIWKDYDQVTIIVDENGLPDFLIENDVNVSKEQNLQLLHNYINIAQQQFQKQKRL